jgi:prepilin-type N-terminal cleavage/methylation domain-containing protein
MNGKRTYKESGFTLIELLVAISILGIVSGTVLIQFDMFGTGAGQEFKQILSFLRLQHGRSLRTNSSMKITFDSEEHQFQVSKNGNALDKLTLGQWKVVKPQSSFSIKVSPYQYRPTTIVLENRRGEERRITTDWTRGFKHLQQ